MCVQAFVVKVERDGQQEALLVQRTFEEFQELHSKLRLVFPSSKLPRYTHTHIHPSLLFLPHDLCRVTGAEAYSSVTHTHPVMSPLFASPKVSLAVL